MLKTEPQHRENEYQEYFSSRHHDRTGARMIAWWHRRLLRCLMERIPDLRSLKLLEIGPGHGYFAQACSRQRIDYRGVEMNAAQTQFLTDQGYYVIQGAVPPIPDGDGVQCIYLSHVLEHALDYHHALAILSAARLRVDAKGYVVVVCPDAAAWGVEFWSADWSHGYPTTLRRVSQLMEESGLVVLDARHHVASFMEPWGVFFVGHLFRCIPVTILDLIFKRLTGRDLAYSFMTVFGWRQLMVIGSKSE